MNDRPPSREWFREWFGDEYLALYPHRDEAEAALAVRLYARLFGIPNGPVLDLACGAGRHLRELLSLEIDALGLDLSMVLLAEARRLEPASRLVRGDMRQLPIGDRCLAGLTSFFTSFGYFEDEQDDARVVAEIRRVLRPGGNWMLDFFNADRVRRDLVPRDTKRLGERVVTQSRRIDGDMVVKTIQVEADGGAPELFEERVRLYDPDALSGLLQAGGLAVTGRFGSYRGDDFDVDSERLILAGVVR